MRSLEARLLRLEQATNYRCQFREDAEFNADLRCLGEFELRRVSDALRAGMNGDEAQAAEAESLLALAHARRLGGWTQTDTDTLEKKYVEKRDAGKAKNHTWDHRRQGAVNL